ncbi:hypothetical protein EI555_009187 [Monodon monoceros]|uniref:RING-type E3 ubiquitin transferase n=1 Tax=Monodon monoceros TaxID=40151 RepID=A0A4U1FFU2_MONMO|nr:hypothetical protein EI555_009187 [Monodon monoceros]
MGEGPCLHSGYVRIRINSMPKRCAENPSSRNMWNVSWNWATNNFQLCKQKHCKSGFSKKKVLKHSSLYYKLIFLNPTLDHSSFSEVLWIIRITDFVLKLLFIGSKNLIGLLVYALRRIIVTYLDVDDICSVCQGEFQKIILPISQHVFLKNALIALWFYRGNICPLCRTVISDLRNRWKDGAASSYLQIQLSPMDY